MTDRQIKRFKLTGTVVDNNSIDRLKSQWEALLQDEMERKGYVRVYDIDPVFRSSKGKVGFEWELYMQGAFVGKQASSLSGIANGRLIRKSKSSRQSQPAA